MCYDNIKLGRDEEYIIRGIVENFVGEEGMFEPHKNFTVQGGHTDNVIAATGLVRKDKKDLIPVRILTLKDNINLKKGDPIGILRAVASKNCDTIINLRAISNTRG